jgi:uncharacterized membrane protein YedE/YeeE
MGVMGGAVAFNMVSFHFMHSKKHVAVFEESNHMKDVLKMDSHPENLKINWKLIVGAAIFGLGWGLGKTLELVTIRLGERKSAVVDD